MVPPGPHCSSASERAVHGAGDADRQARDAARQAHAVFRLDQEVEMIILRRDDDEPVAGPE